MYLVTSYDSSQLNIKLHCLTACEYEAKNVYTNLIKENGHYDEWFGEYLKIDNFASIEGFELFRNLHGNDKIILLGQWNNHREWIKSS